MGIESLSCVLAAALPAESTLRPKRDLASAVETHHLVVDQRVAAGDCVGHAPLEVVAGDARATLPGELWAAAIWFSTSTQYRLECSIREIST